MKKHIVLFILILILSSNICNSQTGWFSQNSGLTNHLMTVYFINDQTGWAGGFVNAYLKTTNGGSNWVSSFWYSNESVMSLYFLNGQTGWAAGGTENSNHGLITVTTNGGSNWNTQYYNPSAGIVYDMFFLNSETGWGSCGNGNMLLTTNGGLYWNLIYTGINTALASCYFVDQYTGWATGRTGNVLKTTNGGYNWVNQPSGTTFGLPNVYFNNSSTGFIAGDGGVILKTTNAGQNWISKSSGTSARLNAIKFINENTGWIVGGTYPGNTSLILRTTNAGENWNPQNSPANMILTDVFFYNSSTGWASGYSGIILKTNTGGLIIPVAPILVSPPNNSYDISLTPNLVWNPSIGAALYKVQISTTPVFNIITDSASVTATNYTVPNGKLSPAITYFWRVQASNSAGTSAWSEIWNFATHTGPSAPILISPPNYATNVSVNPTLDWNDVSGALYYKVQISTISNFSVLTDTATVTNSQYTVPIGKLMLNYTYFWRVNVTTPSGTSMWSDVWRFTVSTTGITNLNTGIPQKFKLYQNYPNPFNPVTKIKFDIAKNSHTNIIVFDALGKEVEEISKSILQAGSYQFVFNGSKYVSGIYFIRLNTSEYSETIKILLVK